MIGPMPVTVAPARTEEELIALLPLIADYQRFYGVEQPDDDHNRQFFRRFLADGGAGMLLIARDDDTKQIAGHACLYWSQSSISARDVVLMNDLYVKPEHRGTGAGRALIDAAAQVARDRGAAHLEWQTAPDNVTAQRLYDQTGATASTWLTYELAV